jgi:hypothetical protein
MSVFMAITKKKNGKAATNALPLAEKRQNRVTILLSDREMGAIDAYCKRYKVKSKARFIREQALRAVMTKFLDDYPTLFRKNELDSLVVPHAASDVLANNYSQSNGEEQVAE